MAVITIPSNKHPEYSDLETHVLLCEHRRLALEEKIKNLEKEVEQIKAQNKTTKKLILGAVISIITGIMTTVFSVALNYNFS
jgi:hypothetical protein